jgi:hypothetical protein
MTDPDPLPPPGSPAFRRTAGGTVAEHANTAPYGTEGELPPLPQPGRPSGVAEHAAPVSIENQRVLEAHAGRESRDAENAARGQIVRIIPELRLPKFLVSGTFLMGIIAILSLVGLFVFAQAITVFSQISLLPTVPRQISHAFLVLFLTGILSGAVRLLLACARLRSTQKITLSGIESLNERARFRKFAEEEGARAFQIVRSYLDDFPTDPRHLVGMGFTVEQASRLSASRSDLTNTAKDLGPHEWLQRFRRDFQSVADEAAEDCIRRRARGVGVKVAALPLPFVETAIVLHGAFSMIADLCQIYRLRLGAGEALIVTGWAAIQGLIAGQLDNLSGNREADSWAHEFQSHFGGAEAVASMAHETGAETMRDAASVFSHAVTDLHIPLVGRLLKRGAKGFLQYMLLRRLGCLTQRWLRMVD